MHSSKILSIPVETINALQKHVSALSDMNVANIGRSVEEFDQIFAHIKAQACTLQSLLLRSQFNKERSQNKLALVSTKSCYGGLIASVLICLQHDRSAGQLGYK